MKAKVTVAMMAGLMAVALCSPLAMGQTTKAAGGAETRAAATEALPKVAVVKLTGELKERPAGLELFSFGESATALSDLLVKLNKAAKDPAVGGVLLDLKGFNLTLAQAQEIGAMVRKLRDAKKRVAVFAGDFDTATYVLASHADTVIMPEQGTVLMPGVQMGMIFFKGMLDKIDVQADFVQVGKYKGAEEPFTRTEASAEYKAQIDGLADGFYQQIVATVNKNRGLVKDEATTAVDEGWLTGKRAKALGLVDQLMARDKVDKWFQGQFADGAELVENYGEAKKTPLELDSPLAIFQLLGDAGKKPRSNTAAVAVIYADGTIMGDTGNESPFGDEETVTPGRMRKAVTKAVEDPRVKALVLRIDSPGGSASASDEIWQILRDADAKKPVTVSMGRMAASGGYYIATAGRTITADEATITGSIGVVGGKVVINKMLKDIGVNVQPVYRGKHAGMLGLQEGFTEEERGFIRTLMTETYDLFVQRVKAGRGEKIKDVDSVAQGRLFTGTAAKKAGLVDEVGTLGDVVLTAAKTAGIEKNYQVLTFPEPKTLTDILREGFKLEMSLPAGMDAAMKVVPVEYRHEAAKGLQMLEGLRREHVMVTGAVGVMER